MQRIELPYVYAYRDSKEYAMAMKPFMKQWRQLFQGSEFKSPFEQHKWCWEQPEAETCYQLEHA